MRASHAFLMRQAAWTALGGGALLWAANLVLLTIIGREVRYTVCSGPLLHLPPGTLHWPPLGHNLYLVTWQHADALAALGLTVVGMFLLLAVSPQVPTWQRTLTLLGTLLLSLLATALLGLMAQYDLLRAHLDALVRCL